MTQEEITSLLFQRASNGLTEPVLWPNVGYDTPSGKHFVASILPAGSDSVSFENVDRVVGIFQLMVVVPAGSGVIDAYKMADAVSALFPRNLKIHGVSNYVLIDSSVDIAPAINNNDGWFRVPASINYTVIN